MERNGNLVVEKKQDTYKISGEEFFVEISVESGLISNYSYHGKVLLQNAGQPNFWRAPIDNDLGNQMPERLKVWREATYNRGVERIILEAISEQEILVKVDFDLPAVNSKYELRYKVFGDGTIEILGQFSPSKDIVGELPELPRFGLMMQMPAEFDNLKWYGRGPHENYIDRKSSALFGIYNSTIAEQYHPYIRPQENGNKTDARWVDLTDRQGVGLKILGSPQFDFSAQQYIPADFDSSDEGNYFRHTFDVVPKDFITLQIDFGQMGVGGDDSWGAHTHDNYKLFPKPYTLQFKIIPLS